MKMRGIDEMREMVAGFKERLAREEGFSIAELLVATLLLFVLTFSAFNFAQGGVTWSRAGMYNAEVNQEWREAMNKMTWQMRVAYYFVPSECTTDSIGFWSYASGGTDKYHIRFYLDSDTSELVTSLSQAGINPTVSTIATGVQDLSFVCYDSSGLVTTSTTAIKRVEISMRLTRSYETTAGTSSEGHRQEVGAGQTVSAEGIESVTIRNVLTAAP
jgi:hypothetical protein